MSTKIESVELMPRSAGWTSGTRDFGTFLTFVAGENGAGKTPLMKAIVYALGHPLKLTDAVKEHCASIVLTLRVGKRLVRIERSTHDEDRHYLVEVRDGDTNQEFDGEAEFTDWLIAALRIPRRTLAGKVRGTIYPKPYASVLTPIYWLDQDHGWRVPYSPLNGKDFLKSQGEEAVRWMLGVAQRHPAVDKKEQIQLENEIDTTNSLIRARQAAIRELSIDLPDSPVEVLAEQKRRIVEQLSVRQDSLRSVTDASKALVQEYDAIAGMVEQTRRRRAALDAERQKLERAAREIEADQEVLLANENAADLFRRVVCSNTNCGFFRQPAESFGRRLLFVKDQLKDLYSAISSIGEEVKRADAVIHDRQQSLEALATRVQHASQAAGTEGLVAAVDALAAELQKVTLDLVRHEQLAEEQLRLARVVERRRRAQDALDEIGGTRRSADDRTRQVRQLFETNVVKWLKTVNTPNLQDVAVNDSFEITVKGRRFNYDSSESGSTRTRFVLAYHAALLDTSFESGGHHPPWLICDAPRQQEIKVEDLNAWVDALRTLADEHPFQLVLSGKDVFLPISETTDKLWQPTFTMGEPFPQYLGPSKS